MRRDREQAPSAASSEPEPVLEPTLTQLRQAIIRAILEHSKMDPQLSGHVEEHLVLSELSNLSDVWWLVSLEAVRILLVQEQLHLISFSDNQALSIKLSKAQQREVQTALQQKRPIARYGLLNVYLQLDALTGSLRLEVREERTLSGMAVMPNTKLIVEAARPIIEASSHGDDIRSVVIHPQTGVVTYFYQDKSWWEVGPSDRDYEVHRRVANGEYITIGYEIATPVLCSFAKNRRGFREYHLIDGNHGNVISSESAYFDSPESVALTELLPRIADCTYQGADTAHMVSGVLILTLDDGSEMTISSETTPHQYIRLVTLLIDQGTIRIGHMANGNKLYFHASAGLLTGNFDWQQTALPAQLAQTPLFHSIHSGNFYTMQANTAASTYIGGRQHLIHAKDPAYQLVERLIDGQVAVIPYWSKTRVASLELRVYCVSQTSQGITIDDYPASINQQTVAVHWPAQTPTQYFTLPPELLNEPLKTGLSVAGAQSLTLPAAADEHKEHKDHFSKPVKKRNPRKKANRPISPMDATAPKARSKRREH